MIHMTLTRDMLLLIFTLNFKISLLTQMLLFFQVWSVPKKAEDPLRNVEVIIYSIQRETSLL